MTRTPATLFPLALLPFVALSGCISFGAKPPPSLLTLTSTATVPVGQGRSVPITTPGQRIALSAGGSTTTLAAAVPPAAGSASLTIQVPMATQEIATARVPVQATATSIAYIKDAVWVEPPARAFARVLGDTVTARTGRVVLSTAQSFATGSAQLTGELRRFGIDAASSSAVVTFDATLVRQTEGGAVEKQRFEARVPVASIDAAGAGAGLNAAANQVAAQVADWVGR